MNGRARGSLITDVTYASYGTPTGTCPGPFTDGACNGTNWLGVVNTLRQGLDSCSFAANNATSRIRASGPSAAESGRLSRKNGRVR